MANPLTHRSPFVRSTFTKGTEALVVECRGNAEILLLFEHAQPQVFRFDDPTKLVLFQSDLEQRLVQTGWTLSTFESQRPAPESSAGGRA